MTMSLGDTIRDTITGLQGVAVARHEYLNGCVRISIQPAELKDGKPVETTTFDIEQLEMVTKAPKRKVIPTGGPHDEPARASIPSR